MRRPWLFILLLLAACGDGDELSPIDEGTGVEPVQDFKLPSRSAVSRHELETTDPFPRLRFDNATQVLENGDRFYVAEQGGKIFSFVPRASTEEKTLVLDLSEHTVAGRDTGLVSFAFHPERPGELYVYYAFDDEPLDSYESSQFAHELRLARFTIPEGELAADPSSEVILIALPDRHLFHQGGGLLFHPGDGFLYLANGDEGGYDCRYKTCQRQDTLFGGVLRIDVDMRGGEISHPIRKPPPVGMTDHYFIPSDNPFLDDPDAMEELYAIGLRNPWRMTYDPVDDQIWIGDVGQESHDEIDALAPGANYQWDMFEGDEAVETPSDPTRPRIGAWTDPAISYQRSEMRAITMGPVYRGAALPSLYGKLLHADFVRGNLWAASYEIEDGRPVITDSEIVLETELIDADAGATSFMVAADGAIYITSYGQDRPLVGLASAPIVAEDTPSRLSQTGLFRDLEALEPASNLVEYEVNTPLWSDGSHKRRFIAVPEGERATYAARGQWDLPEGTVLVKHFARALDERKPDELRRLETRVLVVEEGRVYGATYKWREDQSDADLLLEHLEEPLTIIDADGDEREETHIYPGPGECVRCHHAEAGDSLGFNTAQLNRTIDGEPQLRMLEDRELVEGLPNELDDLPKLAALDDEDATQLDRVRSYLDANCSFCHGDSTLRGARWDARIETPLEDAHILDAPLLGESEDGELRVIDPGDPEDSQIFLRASTTDREHRMPPLASSRPDAQFLELLEDWIESLERDDDEDDEDD